MKKKIQRGLIAILLAMVMLIQSTPANLLKVLADGIVDALTKEETVEQEINNDRLTDAGNIGSGYIVQENKEKRTERTKEYLMSDDMIMVEQYEEAIHYYEKGEYKEIDNALEEIEEDGKKVIKNKANSFGIKFSKEEPNDIAVEENGYGFKIRYVTVGKQTPSAEITSGESIKESREIKGKKRPEIISATKGEIKVSGLETDTDVKHTIRGKKLISEITINKIREEYKSVIRIETSNLQFKQGENGKVYATDAKGEVKFIIPKPQVKDANGETSEVLEYVLTGNGGKTELTIVADAEWINSRAKLPIKIETKIQSEEKEGLNYISVHKSEEKEISAEKPNIEKTNGTEKSSVFFSVRLPVVKPYYELLGATVRFKYQTNAQEETDGGENDYNVFVTESTEDLSSITTKTKIKKLQCLEGEQKTSETREKTYESGIINTNNVKDDVLTIGIEPSEQLAEQSYMTMSTIEDSVSVLVWYKIAIGIEDEYSMEEIGTAGVSSYVNNATGRLTSVFELLSVNTLSEMPFELSLVYNDYYDILMRETGKTETCGKNFKLNFEQYLLQHGAVYELIDADGSISTFTETIDGKYYSKEKSLHYNPSTGIIYDLTGNQMKFINGRLTKIWSTNKQSEYITVSYLENSDQITKVEYFAESTSKYSMEFTYVDGRITTVVSKSGANTLQTRTFTYDENGNLISVSTGNIENYQMIYDEVSIEVVLETGVGYERHEYLKEIQTLDKKMQTFFRSPGEKIYEMRILSVHPISSRVESRIYYTRTGNHTTINYYYEDIITSNKYVSFNNVMKVISEWEEGANGIVTLSATTNWMSESQTSADYTEETFSYNHKISDRKNWGIKENGNSLTTYVGGDSENEILTNNYRHAIIMRIAMSGTYENAGMHIEVFISGEGTYTVQLEKGARTYVCIPCEYFTTSRLVRITNRGTEDVAIEYFKYDVIDSVQNNYEFNEEENRYNLSSIESNSRGGTYNKATYDNKQRVSTVETRRVDNDSVLETTNYAYYEAGLPMMETMLGITDANRGKIKSITTTKPSDNGTETIRKEEYGYSGSWANYTETVKTSRGDVKSYSRYNVERGATETKLTQTNENNVTSMAYYKLLSGDYRLDRTQSGNTIERYTYNSLGQVINVSLEGTGTSQTISQSNQYDQNGWYVGSQYGATNPHSYTYGYDGTGYVTSISGNLLGEQTTYMQYAYNDTNVTYGKNAINKKTYANGNVENYTYGANLINTQVTHKESETATATEVYEYNSTTQGQLKNQSYKKNGNLVLTYDYGQLDEVNTNTFSIMGLQYNIEYTRNYNNYNRRIESESLLSRISCATTDYKIKTYEYDSDGQISRINNSGNVTNYAYDKAGRLTNKNVPYSGSMKVADEDYIYRTYSSGTDSSGNAIYYNTNQLVKIDDKTYENNDKTATYNANGMVTQVTYNGKTYSYTYDNLGRLTSETKNGVTKSYSYDEYNNVQKTGLQYTNGILTRINNYSVRYDEMGNPIIYKGNSFHWSQGRKLESGSMNNKSFTYSYDGNGMRFKKVVSGATTEYYYNGTQLLMENRQGNRMYYLYGVTGIEGIIYDYLGYDAYYFDKNTLGDVVAIRDSEGYIVATYDYDAWGNVTVYDSSGQERTDANFVGNINPIRYRGYYYDTETGFYYLQTRYYDPTICRFINADNYELISELSSVAGQLNMYAYCGNNPVMYTDENGEGILTMMLIGALIGGVLSAGIDVVTQLQENGSVDIMQTILSFLGGALSGAVAASPLGVGWQIGINAGIGVLLNVAEQTSSGKNFNGISLVNDGLSGVLSGFFGGKGVYNVGNQLIDAFKYTQDTISNVKAIVALNRALRRSTSISMSILLLKDIIGA